MVPISERSAGGFHVRTLKGSGHFGHCRHRPVTASANSELQRNANTVDLVGMRLRIVLVDAVQIAACGQPIPAPVLRNYSARVSISQSRDS